MGLSRRFAGLLATVLALLATTTGCAPNHSTTTSREEPGRGPGIDVRTPEPEPESPPSPLERVEVVSAWSGEPLDGARLVLGTATRTWYRSGPSEPTFEPTRTVASGASIRAEFDDASDRLLGCRAEAPGHVASPVQVLEEESGPVVRIALTPGTVLRGRVVEAGTDRGVTGARVRASRSFGDWDTDWRDELVTTTSEDGSFALDAVPGSAVLSVEVTSEGFGSAARLVRTAPAGRAGAPVSFEVGHACAVTGVCTMNGRPVENATVYATADDVEHVRGQQRRWPWPLRGIDAVAVKTQTDANGRFRLEPLGSGLTYTLYAIGGIDDHAGRVEVGGVVAGEPDPATCDLDLVPYPRLFVRLVDAAGEPVPNAQLAWYVDGHGQYNATGDDEGWVQAAPELGGLAPGRRTLTARSGRFPPVLLNAQLPSTGDVRVVHRLGAETAATGCLLDATGEPAASVHLRAVPAWDPRTARIDPYELRQQSVEAVTNGEGRFRLAGLLDRPYTLLRAVHGNQWATVGTIEASADEQTLRDVAFGRIGLRVELADGVAAPRRIRVTSHLADDPGSRHPATHDIDPAEARTRAVLALPSGRHELTIWADGLRPVSRTVEIGPSGDPLPVDVYLAPSVPVTGRVLDQDGRPLSGVEVHLPFDDVRWFGTGTRRTTDEDGRFRIDDPPEGPFELRLALRGYATWTRRIDFPRGGALREIVLPNGEAVVFTFENAHGARLADARFTLRSRGPNAPDDAGPERDAAPWGSVVDYLPAGSWEIRVRHPELGERTVPFEVQSGRVNRVPVRFE